MSKIKYNKINIDSIGNFTIGLNSNEIDEYLKIRSGKNNIKSLRNRFDKIAGRNTCGTYTCSKCNNMTILMYRYDVERFADILFGKTKETYFD